MIELMIDGRTKDLGGFTVSRILPAPRRRMVGPFIFLDHMGPADFAPGQTAVNVRPHPHIGLSTLTYLFDGEIMHRDSLGVTQAIRPGEVNWMTAGKGVVHSERTDPARIASGGRLDGMQAWIALPTESEEADPFFSHHEGAELPAYEQGGLFARLVAGDAYGAKAATPVSSPMFYVHWEMAQGVRAAPPKGKGSGGMSERAVYVAKGMVEVDGHKLRPGQLAVLSAEAEPVIEALHPSTVMLLGGEPVGERLIWWNFVSSSKDRLEQAKADWAAGRMALPPGDDQEFIPLPEDPPVSPPQQTHPL
ncbi:pirin family protein [Brevundimonas sp. 2R-24]|uniref:Pirin family protein n=1 Tax=Peiella sedimenti TaxID=3061083 RepID=A0ABT8SHA0_9CAUL|nr:pirin family protein [Caulobacteraceae bacterium XZ-24]